MLVTYVDRCAVCACSSLRDEGGRRPVPGLSTSCAGGCACHDAPPAAISRSARASSAASGHDAARFRLFRRARRTAASTRQPAVR